MSKFCEVCGLKHFRKISNICKKCYYRTYFAKKEKPKKFCVVCDKLLENNHRVRCVSCKPTSTCIDCNKQFCYKAKYVRCPSCYYYHYQKINPENAEKVKKISNAKSAAKRKLERRDLKGVPHDHILRVEGGRKEGYLCKGYRLFCIPDPYLGKKRRVWEHVLVMENYLQRKLIKGESVHHKMGFVMITESKTLNFGIKVNRQVNG